MGLFLASYGSKDGESSLFAKLLWLLLYLWLVIKLPDWIIANWDALSKNPGLFVGFFILALIVTFAINYGVFNSRIKTFKIRLDFQKEIVKDLESKNNYEANLFVNSLRENLSVKESQLAAREDQIGYKEKKIDDLSLQINILESQKGRSV